MIIFLEVEKNRKMKFYQRYFVLVILFLVVGFAGCSATPDRESTGEFFDSSLITAKVKARLIDDRITGSSRIKVSTRKGVVYLSGYVNSDYEKDHASIIANGVNGVKGIENGLVIRSTK